MHRGMNLCVPNSDALSGGCSAAAMQSGASRCAMGGRYIPTCMMRNQSTKRTTKRLEGYAEGYKTEIRRDDYNRLVICCTCSKPPLYFTATLPSHFNARLLWICIYGIILFSSLNRRRLVFWSSFEIFYLLSSFFFFPRLIDT